MRVELLGCTEHPELSIYLASRQCYYPGSVLDMDTDGIGLEELSRLASRCCSAGHRSVLEFSDYMFGVAGISRVAAQQLTRHRIASYAMQSQRYVDFTSRGVEFIIPPTIEAAGGQVLEKYLFHMRESQLIYTELQNAGIPSEDARYALTLSTSSNLVFKMNPTALLHFWEERLCNKAQWEVRDLAQKTLRAVVERTPMVRNMAGPKCFRLRRCPETQPCSGPPSIEQILL